MTEKHTAEMCTEETCPGICILGECIEHIFTSESNLCRVHKADKDLTNLKAQASLLPEAIELLQKYTWEKHWNPDRTHFKEFCRDCESEIGMLPPHHPNCRIADLIAKYERKE